VAETTLADTFMIARMTRRAPGTVRSWASRGLLTRKGTGKRGRALYDMDEAEALAVRLDMARPACNGQSAAVQSRPESAPPAPGAAGL
jgi:hypothetical protein